MKKKKELLRLKDEIKSSFRKLDNVQTYLEAVEVIDSINVMVDAVFYHLDLEETPTPLEEQAAYVKWCQDNNKKASDAANLFNYLEEGNKKC